MFHLQNMIIGILLFRTNCPTVWLSGGRRDLAELSFDSTTECQEVLGFRQHTRPSGGAGVGCALMM
jgi:hypothetical protein